MNKPPAAAAARRGVGPGDVIAEKYRVERVLGAGGMGQVLAARHLELGSTVAIKLVHEAHVSDPMMLVRFKREARAMARLKSEHVVRVHDVGETANGVPFMVMELLEGRDLAATVIAQGPLPAIEVVGYIVEACDAVAEAHDMGIIHRDLKPHNLFLARKPNGLMVVKVLDFGLAKSVAEGDMAVLGKSTMLGEVVGTPGYMAPEQLEGRPVPQSDLWGLGVCLYRLLTAKSPFPKRQSIPEFAKVLREAPPTPILTYRPDLPPALVAVVDRCLRRRPAERYASARELADALLQSVAEGDATIRIGGIVDALAQLGPRSEPRVRPAMVGATTQPTLRSAEHATSAAHAATTQTSAGPVPPSNRTQPFARVPAAPAPAAAHPRAAGAGAAGPNPGPRSLASASPPARRGPRWGIILLVVWALALGLVALVIFTGVRPTGAGRQKASAEPHPTSGLVMPPSAVPPPDPPPGTPPVVLVPLSAEPKSTTAPPVPTPPRASGRPPRAPVPSSTKPDIYDAP